MNATEWTLQGLKNHLWLIIFLKRSHLNVNSNEISMSYRNITASFIPLNGDTQFVHSNIVVTIMSSRYWACIIEICKTIRELNFQYGCNALVLRRIRVIRSKSYQSIDLIWSWYIAAVLIDHLSQAVPLQPNTQFTRNWIKIHLHEFIFIYVCSAFRIQLPG